MSFDPENPNPDEQDQQGTDQSGDMTNMTADQWAAMFAQLAGGGSEGTFGPGFRYKVREVRGFGPGLSSEAQQAILADVRRMSGSPRMANAPQYYSGEYLVDGYGRISRAPYDPKQDAVDALYSMSPERRAVLQQVLYAGGYYGSSKPSPNGVIRSTDRTAMQEMLLQANGEGVTWDVLEANILSSSGNYGAQIGGGRARTSSAEDINAYLRKASLERLGRTMTKDDVDQAIMAIQQRQAAGSAGSLEAEAGRQVSTINPNLEKAVAYRQAIDFAMGMLGSEL